MKTPEDRPYRLISSRGTARKYVDIAAGQTLALCRIAGRGRIVRFWMTLPVLGRRGVLKDAVLRMTWDGEPTPSVEVPLGDFFGASFGRPLPFVSDRLVIAGGAYLCRFEMPFNDGAIIELVNESARNLRTVFFQIGYYEEPARAVREPTFHAQFRRERRTRAGEPFVALEARGAGWLAGLRMDIQSRAWWLAPPLRDIVLPRGFGLGLLEGWERITVDGDRKAALAGTGAEDYFSGGFYFKGAPFSTPTHGCTRRSFFTGRVSAYRFHLDDPIRFSESLEVAMDHGLVNTMAGDYCSVAYWYQHEQHAPYPALPSAVARRPAFPWTNPVQWLLGASLIIGAIGALVHLVYRVAHGGR